MFRILCPVGSLYLCGDLIILISVKALLINAHYFFNSIQSS